MRLTLVVNPELGWDSVVTVLDRDRVTQDQYDSLEELCERNNYILIDWKYLEDVESFLRDYE